MEPLDKNSSKTAPESGGEDVVVVMMGGGMRSVFCAGAGAALAESPLMNRVSTIVGVSAGAINATYTAARQTHDLRRIYFELSRSEGVVRPFHIWRPLDVDRFPDVFRHVPIAEPWSESGRPRVVAVCTNVRTDRAEYLRLPHTSVAERNRILMASCAIPILYNKSVTIGSERYVDGGLADALPIDHALSLGPHRMIVVLTKPLGHRREADRAPLRHLKGAVARSAGRSRHRLGAADEAYNRSMSRLVSDNHSFSIPIDIVSPDPTSGSNVGRTQVGSDALEAAWSEGFAAMSSVTASDSAASHG